MSYKVTYRNKGKPEKTPTMTLTQAKKSAEFLRFQGAKHIRVVSASK